MLSITLISLVLGLVTVVPVLIAFEVMGDAPTVKARIRPCSVS